MTGARSLEDLFRAVQSVARHFDADRVILVGGQSILLTWPDAPETLRFTPEIDLYPANNRQWEMENSGLEASEEIAAFFGQMSAFHTAFGFYIDGVDEKTARLPPDWQERAVMRTLSVDDREVEIVSPALEDILVSKLHRFSEKDIDFVRNCIRLGRVETRVVVERFYASDPDPDVRHRIVAFLNGLLKT
jgi:hypothetical protein